MVRQFCAHDIGKCSQPELQHGAVRYQPGHVGAHLPGCFVGSDRGELDQWVVDLDKEVDLVSLDLGSTERVRHLGVDLSDDER